MGKTSKYLRISAYIVALLMFFFAIPKPVTAEAAGFPYYIKINRRQNVVTIYKQDSKGEYTVPVKAMTCSTGRNNATPTGTFSISQKYRWHKMMGDVYGQYCSRIHGGVLFHSVYYNNAPDPSRLSYTAYNRLGSQASHGCVRLTVEDAKWIYDYCPSGTKVNIYDSSNPGPLGKPAAIKISPNSPYRGWDPTDPNSANPWHKVKPVFKGLKDITVERCAKKPKLKKNVTATDYKGKKIKFTVKEKINTRKTGKYKVLYTAKDSRGNVTKKTVTVTVKDTKAPKIKIKKKTITISGELSEKKLLKELGKNVTVTDNGEKLAAKYLVINDTKLLKAMEKQKYGVYQVTVYAKDKSGNKSKKKKFKVNYLNPEPEEPEKPAEPEEPVTPEEPENPAEPEYPVIPEPEEPVDTVTPEVAAETERNYRTCRQIYWNIWRIQ